MYRRKFLIFVVFALALATLCWGVGQVAAQSDNQLRRQKAQDQLDKAIEARHKLDPTFPAKLPEYQIEPPATPLATWGPNHLLTITKPNYANTMNLRKFVTTLPGLGPVGCTSGVNCNENEIGQYIPVAQANTTVYPDADYYEIALREYSELMHPDLVNQTFLRGYAQINAAAASVQNVNRYLGPVIIAKRYDPTKPLTAPGNGRPIRLKFFNQLSTLTAPGAFGLAGSLIIPVDRTVMGAGQGPLDILGSPCDPALNLCADFPDNRSDIHLHGAFVPWISDGTPHQWITPATEFPYDKGASFQNVPDMIIGGTSPCLAVGGCFSPIPHDGIATHYYPNQQSGRLMFYHDHAYGITRLNVYSGVAAGYLLYDQVEQDLIEGTNISGIWTTLGIPPVLGVGIIPNIFGTGHVYEFGIPLVIQDKSFVNDPTGTYGTATPTPAGFPAASVATPIPSTFAVDPLWYSTDPSRPSNLPAVAYLGGRLWYPHEYMTNENLFSSTGFNPMGRWDYGPWLAAGLPAKNSELPSPTIVPEAFMDTILVNGAPYPKQTLPPAAFRFRILNASNDRMLNLQLYYAAVGPAQVSFSGGGGTGASATTTVVGGIVKSITLTGGGSGYTSAPTVTILDFNGSVVATAATATATIDLTTGAVNGVTLTGGGSLYLAGTVCKADGAGLLPAGVTQSICTEVKMVSATNKPENHGLPYCADPPANIDPITGLPFTTTAGDCTPVSWPRDGRDGGVPDPSTAGPQIIAIGSEGGFLPNVALAPAQPIDFDYSRRSATFGGIASFSHLLGPAERSDIIVDFSGVNTGSCFIVYNDMAAPSPLYDDRYDYYTGDPDRRGSGGAPSTPAGFGPNTRTIMQICLSGSAVPFGPTGLAALTNALPKAFAASQDRPIVPQLDYNAAFPGIATGNNYATVFNESMNLSGTPQSVASIITAVPGIGYSATAVPPVTVDIFRTDGTVGTDATATACLNGVTAITVTLGGAGYTSPPAVTITNGVGGVGTGAIAVATISGGVVTGINMVTPGCNYLVIPTVGFTGGGGAGATAVATITPGSIGTITVTNPGTGYMSQPAVLISGGGGSGAVADALLTGAKVMGAVSITEGFDVWYGRMNAVLGTLPVPINPTAPIPAVPGAAAYYDPPSDLFQVGDATIWRLSHIGVDSHAVHLHLVNFQVVNRVDWTNTLLPPDPTELGWKETVKTYPFTDVILAFRTNIPVLPFKLPLSNRLLDPTTPLNSTMNFVQVVPVPGQVAPAGLANVPTNFGYEYVWHCHLLGHEENDMMRPFVVFPNAIPLASAPAAAWNPTLGKFHVAFRRADNRVYVGTANIDGTMNNDFIQIPTGSTPSSPAIAWNPTNQRIVLAVRGTVGNVFIGNLKPDGTGWSGWTGIPVTSTLSPAIAWNDTDKKLHMGLTASSNRVFIGSVNYSTGAIVNPFIQLGGTNLTPVSPAIAWNSTLNRIQLAVRGNNNNTLFVGNTASNGTGFVGWGQVGGINVTAVSPSITYNALTGRVEIVVKGSNSTNVFMTTVLADNTGATPFIQVTGAVSLDAPATGLNPALPKLGVFARNATNIVEGTVTAP